jgi:hypothetical protein
MNLTPKMPESSINEEFVLACLYIIHFIEIHPWTSHSTPCMPARPLSSAEQSSPRVTPSPRRSVRQPCIRNCNSCIRPLRYAFCSSFLCLCLCLCLCVRRERERERVIRMANRDQFESSLRCSSQANRKAEIEQCETFFLKNGDSTFFFHSSFLEPTAFTPMLSSELESALLLFSASLYSRPVSGWCSVNSVFAACPTHTLCTPNSAAVSFTRPWFRHVALAAPFAHL